MTEKSLSQLRRAVLTRVNTGKRVSPTALKELLGAEWKRQDELEASLAQTVANLQAVEDDRARSDWKSDSAILGLIEDINGLRESLSRTASELEAVEEDRLREQLGWHSRSETAEDEPFDSWEALSAFGPDPKEAPPFKEAFYVLLGAAAIIAAFVYLS